MLQIGAVLDNDTRSVYVCRSFDIEFFYDFFNGSLYTFGETFSSRYDRVSVIAALRDISQLEKQIGYVGFILGIEIEITADKLLD